MNKNFTQPTNATAKEVNRQSIARDFGVSKSAVGLLNTTTAIDSYSLLFDPTNNLVWFRSNATGTPTKWSLNDGGDSLSLTTSDNTFTLYLATNNYLGDYTAGTFSLTNKKQTISYKGNLYKLNSSTSSYTTTGKSSTTWAVDSPYLINISDNSFPENVESSEGVQLIGSNSDGLYLGCFFDSWNNNEVFIVTSEDAYNWSNPTRLMYEGEPLTVRDPTLIYYKDTFVLLEGGTVDVADCYLYTSVDLINWTRTAVVFNSDGVTPVFSNSRIWSNGGGTVATSKSWAQEPCIDADGNLYIMASLYVGIDTTAGSTTDNLFAIGISQCLDFDTLKFGYPTKMSLYTDSSTADVYSRIDPSLHYDSTNATYVLGVKRENYGYVEMFTSTSITGTFTKVAAIQPPSTAPSTMYFEGPSVFGLRTGGVGVSVDDYYGPTGQWLSTSTDLATFSSPKSMRMPFARHGSIRYYDDLPLSAQYYIAIKQLRGSTIRVNNERPKFTHYTASQTLIPVADTIYWTSTSALTLTIALPTDQPAKRFYVFLNTATVSAYTTISGVINGGDVVIGYGVNNYNLVEFVYNSTDKKYIANARYNPSALYTTGTVQANNMRTNTGLDLGYSNTTAAARQITFYPYGTTTSSGNINASDGKLSFYSNGRITLAATTYVETSGKGYKFPSFAVGSLPAAASYQYVELMCTGMSTSTSGTTITPTTQKVYSDGTNWRLTSDPTIIVA